jgi:aminomuconate-semialdehyde/2-hydroxymuconate-6-semialdehyde dehydrogenase
VSDLEWFGHVIDGVEVDSVDLSRFESVNPWTRSAWAEVALGSVADAAAAVAAARRAFDDGPWPRLGYAKRQTLLHALADAMEAHADELASADSRDMGKPLAQCHHDVARAALNFRFFADHAKMAMAETLPMDTGHHAYTRYEPAGVVVAIAPWNFPLMLETWKIAPALAWGNTVVLKPAEDTPTSATILARLATQVGFPPGVLNVVHGYGPNSVGEALTRDSRVDRITFTGESGTGKIISRAAADNLTPVSLEMGGKNCNIVFADAELENAVDWSIQSIFRNAGQICLSGSRLYVQRPIFDTFLERFVAKAETMKFGDPLDPTTEFGPLASQQHFEKVCRHRRGGRWPDGHRRGGRRLVRQADRAGRHAIGQPARLRGDLRPRRGHPPVRDRRRGHRVGQRHRVRPRRPVVHRGPAHRPPGGRPPRRRDGVGELLLHPGSARAVRRSGSFRSGSRGR